MRTNFASPFHSRFNSHHVIFKTLLYSLQQQTLKITSIYKQYRPFSATYIIVNPMFGKKVHVRGWFKENETLGKGGYE